MILSAASLTRLEFGFVVGWYPGKFITGGQLKDVFAFSASLEMSTKTGPGLPVAAK